jgi:arylsulfatase A-like enzyme
MKQYFSRRTFLKTAGMLSAGAVLPSFFRSFQPLGPAATGKQNVLILVFDAWSAYNISLYGYNRQTTPNIAKWADRAIVYHNHFAAGNFSTPGTASLLTGVLPWKHRALRFAAEVDKSFVDKTIFSAFRDYYRIAYSHNPLVNVLLEQFTASLNDYIPLSRLLLTNDGLLEKIFKNDVDDAAISWSRIIEKADDGSSYSLFLSYIYAAYQESKIKSLLPKFPLGLPFTRRGNFFTLEQAVDQLEAQTESLPQPFLGYFHLMPPHEPYRTRLDFYDRFNKDGLKLINKPEDLFTQKISPQLLVKRREEYDEFILYVDDQFEKFMEGLDRSGLLKDTWVILTSDHGQLFERGIMGHFTPVLYQPIVRIPLIVFEPGREKRVDIYSPTSAVDLLPTLLHITDKPSADWTDGQILPPFSEGSPDPNRKIYVIESKETKRNSAISQGTLALLRGKYKLVFFFGYDELNGKELVQLYDIEQDPQELNNLYPSQRSIGDALLSELKSRLAEMNKPYL